MTRADVDMAPSHATSKISTGRPGRHRDPWKVARPCRPSAPSADSRSSCPRGGAVGAPCAGRRAVVDRLEVGAAPARRSRPGSLLQHTRASQVSQERAGRARLHPSAPAGHRAFAAGPSVSRPPPRQSGVDGAGGGIPAGPCRRPLGL
jgi:hypothetical protein